MIIAIDGLGVNGKSTLSKKIASALNFKNFNTGAIYRCIARYILQNNIDINDIDLVLEKIKGIDIDFIEDKVFLNGEDVTKSIRTEEISFYSTKWATIEKIKEFVRQYQKSFISLNDTVIEGRDICTRIAPHADVKFYLYSDFETRVKRLWNTDKSVSIDSVRENLKIRDELDINGGNFLKPQNAIEIDVSNYSLEEVFNIMMDKIQDVKRNIILDKVEKLIKMYNAGKLGGEVMPEDANPHFAKDSLENYMYFTLPMALNYQRNSYTLWESALKTYEDESTRFVFNPQEVLSRSFEEVQSALVKYRVALQKNKQTEIWIKLCDTFVELYNGDIRQLFEDLDNDVDKIRNFIQKENKAKFPYLSGTKLCNYWMYVIYQYTDRKYKNIENLTVAPDTHVVKATHKLGLITDEELQRSDVQLIVIDRWNTVFKDTKYKPIDIHTPLWLWSRNGFKNIE